MVDSSRYFQSARRIGAVSSNPGVRDFPFFIFTIVIIIIIIIMIIMIIIIMII